MFKNRVLFPSGGHLEQINPRIILLALGMFAIGTDAFVVAGVVPTIAKETSVPESLAGQLVTVFSLAYGLGAPIMAALTGHLAPKVVLLTALGAFCLANVGSALAPTFSLLLLTRLIGGVLVAAYAPLAYTVGVQLAPPGMKGRALGLVAMGYTLATVLGSPLGIWIGEYAGWRMSFGLVALLAGISLVGLLLVGLPQIERGTSIPLQARLAPIVERRILVALLPSFLWNTGIFLTYTYIAPLVQQGMHLADVSGLVLLFGLGAVFGNWLGGTLADRFGSQRPQLICLSVLIIVEAVMWFAIHLFVSSLVLLFVWGMCYTILYVLQQHRLLDLAPEYANVILGLNSSAVYLGIAAGAGIGGIVLHQSGVAYLGWASAICAFLALIPLFLSGQMNTRTQDLVPSQSEVEHAREEVTGDPR